MDGIHGAREKGNTAAVNMSKDPSNDSSIPRGHYVWNSFAQQANGQFGAFLSNSKSHSAISSLLPNVVCGVCTFSSISSLPTMAPLSCVYGLELQECKASHWTASGNRWFAALMAVSWENMSCRSSVSHHALPCLPSWSALCGITDCISKSISKLNSYFVCDVRTALHYAIKTSAACWQQTLL